MRWSFTNDRPIYLQIVEQLQLAIVAGELAPGGRMSPVRDLAIEAAVNPNTMQKALSELERSELIYTQRTNGRFITEDTQKIEQLRHDLAREHLLEFIGKMQQLGYSLGKITEVLNEIVEEEKRNDK